MIHPAPRPALLAPPLAVALALAMALSVLAARPALAQVGAPTGVTRAPSPAAPTDPAAAPPAPADLTRPPRPATPPTPLPLFTLSSSMQNLPAGGWRIGGPSATGKVDAATTNALAEIGRYLAHRTSGRVTIVAQVSSPTDDLSIGRRASLANAQTVRRLLEAGGLPGTRIDLRPLGRTASGQDTIEVLPPGIPSPSLGPQAEQAAPRP
jgi:hypothetical protein